MMLITDLACELLRQRPATIPGLTCQTVQHDQLAISTTKITTTHAADTIGKPIGTYLNIATTSRSSQRRIAEQLTTSLKALLPRLKKILVIGLGNDYFIADSLGPRVLKQIRTSTACVTFEPNVFGVTGINSSAAIQAITKLTQPSAVIVIDSLVSATPERIGTNYQICTSGIIPGSGIGRNNQRLDQQLLGVPVIALGVPVCTILTAKRHHLYHVVPKDIENVIQRCATIMAQSINKLVSRNAYGESKP